MLFLVVKYLHIISTVFLFGFGFGSYLYFVAAHRTRNPVVVEAVGRMVVWFDARITTAAGVLQVVTGAVLAKMTGYSFASGWLPYAIGVFAVVGTVWLPVLWLQKQLVLSAVVAGAGQLSKRHWRLYAWWFWMGVAGFTGMFLIALAMVTKLTMLQLLSLVL